jgi:hypothetical protein
MIPNRAFSREKGPESGIFVTCNMLCTALEMYSAAPIKDMRRRESGGGRSVNQEWNMIGTVARWGHNTLLVGLALMTCVIFLSLFR